MENQSSPQKQNKITYEVHFSLISVTQITNSSCKIIEKNNQASPSHTQN